MEYDKLVEQTLVERFEPYFKHRDQDHYVLKLGDRTTACKNVRLTLIWLGLGKRDSGGDPELFDGGLSVVVRQFQKKFRHTPSDGCVGPGTRSLLVTELLKRFGASKFAQLDGSHAIRVPTVFMSYAWHDESQVNKRDQWLRDNGVRVIRDREVFTAGFNIEKNIWKSALLAEKVIAIYSEQSKSRDWPSLEQLTTSS